MKLNKGKVFKYLGLMAWMALFSSVALSQTASDSTIHYDRVDPNVPYSQVSTLPFVDAHEIFSYGESDQQKVYYWPAFRTGKKSKRNRPILVFIHGGCWLAQFDITHSLPLTTALAMQGYDVYSIEYRRTGNGGEWPVALHDNLVAMEYIANHKKRIVDASKQEVVLLGHSAGGHLASLVAARITTVLVNETDLYPLFAQTHLIGLAPIINLPKYAMGTNSCQTATPSFMQSMPTGNQYLYKKANPLNYSLEGVSNKIMFAGGKDTIVPKEMAKHRHANNIVVADAGHFDWIHPGSPAFNSLIQQLENL